MIDPPILCDFDPIELVELCRDPAGVAVDLIEVTGMRLRDLDALRVELHSDVVASFNARPERRRIVVWSHASWLQEHAPEEHSLVREWLEETLRELQNPWRLPLTGQVGCAVLAGPLPVQLETYRAAPQRDLEYEAERSPERRSQSRS
ncbi:MAG: hypothetical protein ABI200_05240 [Gaiellales bacterium]